ncbi:flagellar basal body-associated protein FliL [Rhodosalinus halophilus]|uniref:Flagellar protein FliL n=1 Tax=Rhodosalinus halophilus TaxID=2259333 RepID=A0A365U7V0_9RHOB|nr:flagellar basal body-associated FliL family protein [Rhodosalinus halophilus]RBI84629.1 flagellar basal body-associated protein FliL [Rhodosalinus halophilus]
MGKLLPVLLALAGLGAGVGAGLMLPAAPAPQAAAPTEACAPAETEVAPPPDGSREYVKLAQQFVVPVLEGDRVGAMVVLSLSLEVLPGAREAVFEREPKLRDTLLQVLFDHANMGGFGAEFMGAANLDLLRRSLAEAARQIMPDRITDVLIVDMARQDV